MAVKKRKKDSMEDCECCDSHCCGGWKFGTRSGCGGIYGLGFVGAAIYYISTASGFWMGVLGVLKAIVWPAFLIFEMLKFLGA